MSEDLANVMGSFIETELNAYEEIYKELEEKDKEIERLNQDIKTLLKENGNKEKVIIKQDNIINELEKWAEGYIFADIFKDKIKELKGDDKE